MEVWATMTITVLLQVGSPAWEQNGRKERGVILYGYPSVDRCEARAKELMADPIRGGGEMYMWDEKSRVARIVSAVCRPDVEPTS